MDATPNRPGYHPIKYGISSPQPLPYFPFPWNSPFKERMAL